MFFAFIIIIILIILIVSSSDKNNYHHSSSSRHVYSHYDDEDDFENVFLDDEDDYETSQNHSILTKSTKFNQSNTSFILSGYKDYTNDDFICPDCETDFDDEDCDHLDDWL